MPTPSWSDLQSDDDEVRKAAVTELWVLHRRAMHALARSLLRNSADAEEAVQETFCRFGRAVRRIEPRCSPRTYLMRAHRNTCIDFLRQRPPNVDRNPSAMSEYTDSDSQRRTPIAELESKERYARLWQLIHNLPEASRTAIVLRFMCEFANAEAAEIMMMNTGAFATRLHRALKALSNLMNNDDP